MIGYLADGVVGGTALAALVALACCFEAVRARPALVFAMWAVVIARFLVPGLVAIELPVEAVASFAGATEPTATATSAEAASSSSAIGWTGWVTRIWLVGVAFLSILTAVGWFRLRRRIASLSLASESQRARALLVASELGIKRSIDLRLDPERGPYAVGIARPVVVLPVWLDESELGDVLAHELAHHRRFDPAVSLLARAAQVTFFFWPVIWYATRQLAAARERATDRLAVRSCRLDPRKYARALVRVTLTERSRHGLATAMAAPSSQLRSRISGLLRPSPSGIGKLGALGLGALILLALPGARLASAGESLEPNECTITPGVGQRILASHPDADRDGDGVLSRDEICEHQRRMQRRLRDAAVRAEVLVDSEHYWSSASQLNAVAGAAVCTPAANRCVEEVVLIDVSTE